MSAQQLAIAATPETGLLDAVICGSFRRDREGLATAYRELLQAGSRVTSSVDVVFVDERDRFVRADHELDSDPNEIERGHLAGIQAADFVWLHAPDGYLGASGAFEVGYANLAGIPSSPVFRAAGGVSGVSNEVGDT